MVAVKKDGSLTQYKPDLKEAKSWPGPSKAGLLPVSIFWLSTYEFLVGYREGEERPGLWLVKGSKAGTTEYVFFDDICYSTGEGASLFSCQSLPSWGTVCIASSTSLELGVLGVLGEKAGDGWKGGEVGSGAAYTQWILEDNARAELPLVGGEEFYPRGLAIATTATRLTEIGEGQGPPSPILLMLSSDGLLCPFSVVNMRPSALALCAGAQELSSEGRKPGSVTLPSPAPPKPAATPSKPLPSVAAIAPVAASAPPPAYSAFTPVVAAPNNTSIFNANTSSLFNAPSGFAQSTPVKPNQAQATVIPSKAAPAKVIPTTKSSSLERVAAQLSSQATPSPPTSREATPVSGATSAKIAAAIEEEFKAFAGELNGLRVALADMQVDVGEQEEKVALASRVRLQETFTKDVIETTKCQNAEISELRSSTLETFGWLEEARSREGTAEDCKYLQLLRARPLDPRSQRQLASLRAQFLYCEQQVEEGSRKLDLQWEAHTARLKRAVRGPVVQEGERLAEALLTNHQVLENQESQVEELEDKLRHLTLAYPITMARPGGGASLNNSSVSRAEAEVDKLAEALREQSRIRAPDLKNKLLAEGSKIQAQSDEVRKRLAMVSTPPPLPRSSIPTSPVKRLSPEKEASLKSMLEKKPLTVTKAKSAANAASPLASPSSAETLTRLRDSSRKPPSSLQVSTKTVVTPTKPPTYEPISPAEPNSEKPGHVKPAFLGFAPPAAASSPASAKP